MADCADGWSVEIEVDVSLAREPSSAPARRGVAVDEQTLPRDGVPERGRGDDVMKKAALINLVPGGR